VIRAFIAVEIENPSVLSELIKVKNMISEIGADVKPVEDENIHLTIRFLGEIPAPVIEDVKRILSQLPSMFHSFEMHVYGVGAFPTPSRPRVVWAGVTTGADILHQMRKFIDSEITRRGLKEVHRDQHEFSPHITLARVRSSRNILKLVQLIEQLRDYDFGITRVTAVKLKQSTLTPRGPIYRDLYVVSLG